MDEKKLKPAAQNVLGYIINHGSITGQDAIRDLHMTELRSRVSELRRAGYTIRSSYETAKTDTGTVRFKRYRLEGRS